MLLKRAMRNGEQGADKSHRHIYNPHQAPVEKAVNNLRFSISSFATSSV